MAGYLDYAYNKRYVLYKRIPHTSGLSSTYTYIFNFR